jgi:hypothetical protein
MPLRAPSAGQCDSVRSPQCQPIERHLCLCQPHACLSTPRKRRQGRLLWTLTETKGMIDLRCQECYACPCTRVDQHRQRVSPAGVRNAHYPGCKSPGWRRAEPESFLEAKMPSSLDSRNETAGGRRAVSLAGLFRIPRFPPCRPSEGILSSFRGRAQKFQCDIGRHATYEAEKHNISCSSLSSPPVCIDDAHVDSLPTPGKGSRTGRAALFSACNTAK